MKAILLRINHLDHLIQIKGTGAPQELARKVGMSERSIYSYIKLLKELGAPIRFSRRRRSYYYTEEGCFRIHFTNI